MVDKDVRRHQTLVIPLKSERNDHILPDDDERQSATEHNENGERHSNGHDYIRAAIACIHVQGEWSKYGS